MRIYYFMIISVGLMLLFSMGGINTGSSHLLDFLQANSNETAIVNPTNITATDVQNIKTSGTLWIALAIAIALFAITTVKISAGFASLQVTTDAVIAGFAGFIFAIVAVDFYSIYTFVREITGAVGWEFQIFRILIYSYLIAFVISIIQFIRGSD